MTTSLKPCPFCGEHAHMKELETAHGSTLYGVSCPTEGCLGFAMETYFDTPGQAVAAWNRRAERTCRVVAKERRFSQTQTLVSKSCSACGYTFGDEEHRDLPVPTVLGEVEIPNYCKNCGAKVMR